MRKFVQFFVLGFLVAGCATFQFSSKPIKVGVMPFSENGDDLSLAAQRILVNELKQSENLKVSYIETIPSELRQQLGDHKGNYGPVDFDNSEEGLSRREHIQKFFSADILIFGSIYSHPLDHYSAPTTLFSMQAMDLKTGDLLNNFSVEQMESGISSILPEVVHKLAAQVIQFLSNSSRR